MMTNERAKSILEQHYMLFNEEVKQALDCAIAALDSKGVNEWCNLATSEDLPERDCILAMQPRDNSDIWYMIPTRGSIPFCLDVKDEQGFITDDAVAWKYFKPFDEEES